MEKTNRLCVLLYLQCVSVSGKCLQNVSAFEEMHIRNKFSELPRFKVKGQMTFFIFACNVNEAFRLNVYHNGSAQVNITFQQLHYSVCLTRGKVFLNNITRCFHFTLKTHSLGVLYFLIVCISVDVSIIDFYILLFYIFQHFLI